MKTAYMIVKNSVTRTDWILLLVLALLVFGFHLWRSRRRNEPFSIRVPLVRALLLDYFIFILLLTLIGRSGTDGHTAEWVPFWSWYRVAALRDTWMIEENILNLIFFIPLGILVRLLRPLSVRKTFAWAILLSFVLEVLQFVCCRGLFEWDDMLHNAVGAALGAWLVRFLERRGIVRPPDGDEEKKKRRKKDE